MAFRPFAWLQPEKYVWVEWDTHKVSLKKKYTDADGDVYVDQWLWKKGLVFRACYISTKEGWISQAVIRTSQYKPFWVSAPPKPIEINIKARKRRDMDGRFRSP